MKCSVCGAIIIEGNSFCQNCGAPIIEEVSDNKPESDVSVEPTIETPVVEETPNGVDLPVDENPVVDNNVVTVNEPAVDSPITPEINNSVVSETSDTINPFASPVANDNPVPVEATMSEELPSINPVETPAPVVTETPEIEPNYEEAAPVQDSGAYVATPNVVTPEPPAETNPVNDAVTPTPAAPMTSEAIPQDINVADKTNGEQSNNEQPKKKATGVVIAAIIGGLLLLAVLAIVFFSIFGFINFKKINVKENVTITETENDDTNNYITFGGYKLEISDSYQYYIGSNMLSVENDVENAAIYVLSTPYDSLNVKTDGLQSDGWTIANVSSGSYGEVEFKTAEISNGTNNELVAYTKTSDNKTFAVITSNVANTFNYDILNSLASILSSATYTGEADSTLVKPTDDINSSIIIFDISKTISSN